MSAVSSVATKAEVLGVGGYQKELTETKTQRSKIRYLARLGFRSPQAEPQFPAFPFHAIAGVAQLKVWTRSTHIGRDAFAGICSKSSAEYGWLPNREAA